MTTLPARSETAGLQGHLHLACACDEQGRSYLKEQSFSVPFHLSKSFPENGVLVVNVANPTAGLFRGDSTQSEVTVGPGARLLLTTPSATRVHNTRDAGSETRQRFSVRTGGWLEILPELFIPQQGARHRQRTHVEVEPGGELCFLETLAPGRVASGEIFAFAELDWKTEIWHGEMQIVREKFILSPTNGSLDALGRFSPHSYLATFFLITERMSPDSTCWREIEALQEKELWLGSSRLVAGGWVVKILAGDASRLRRAVSLAREAIHRAAGWPLPLARKL